MRRRTPTIPTGYQLEQEHADHVARMREAVADRSTIVHDRLSALEAESSVLASLASEFGEH